MPSRDLTDVTLVSEDEGCLLIKVGYWWKLSIDKSLLMKVVNWQKMSIDESFSLMKFIYILMKVVFWWKLSIDESWNSVRSDSLWLKMDEVDERG